MTVNEEPQISSDDSFDEGISELATNVYSSACRAEYPDRAFAQAVAAVVTNRPDVTTAEVIASDDLADTFRKLSSTVRDFDPMNFG